MDTIFKGDEIETIKSGKSGVDAIFEEGDPVFDLIEDEYLQFRDKLLYEDRWLVDDPFLKRIRDNEGLIEFNARNAMYKAGLKTIISPKSPLPLLSKDNVLYRARIVSPDAEKDIVGSPPFCGLSETASMAPPKGKATVGRANPKHISYLYASFDEQTAISEVRPIRMDRVNLATIEMNEDLKVLIFADDNMSTHTYAGAIGMLLSRQFFTPVRDADNEEYIVTQFLANYISKMEYDGIGYRSAMNPDGLNICIFNHEKTCKAVATKIIRVTSIEINY
jgi:hypothetical protein